MTNMQVAKFLKIVRLFEISETHQFSVFEINNGSANTPSAWRAERTTIVDLTSILKIVRPSNASAPKNQHHQDLNHHLIQINADAPEVCIRLKLSRSFALVHRIR